MIQRPLNQAQVGTNGAVYNHNAGVQSSQAAASKGVAHLASQGVRRVAPPAANAEIGSGSFQFLSHLSEEGSNAASVQNSKVTFLEEHENNAAYAKDHDGAIATFHALSRKKAASALSSKARPKRVHTPGDLGKSIQGVTAFVREKTQMEADMAATRTLLQNHRQEVVDICMKQEFGLGSARATKLQNLKLACKASAESVVTNTMERAGEITTHRTNHLLSELGKDTEESLNVLNQMPSIYESAFQETLSQHFHTWGITVDLDPVFEKADEPSFEALRWVKQKLILSTEFFRRIGMWLFGGARNGEATQIIEGRKPVVTLSDANIDLVYKSILPRTNQLQGGRKPGNLLTPIQTKMAQFNHSLTEAQIAKYDRLFIKLKLIDRDGNILSSPLRHQLISRNSDAALPEKQRSVLIALYLEIDRALEEKVFERKVEVANEIYQENAKAYDYEAESLDVTPVINKRYQEWIGVGKPIDYDALEANALRSLRANALRNLNNSPSGMHSAA